MNESDRALEELRANVKQKLVAAREAREQAELEQQIGILILIGIVGAIATFISFWVIK